VGIAVLLDNLDVLDVKAKGVSAVLLAIVGAGLLIGAWWGRARWLIAPGIVLALVLGAASLVPLDVRPTFGNVLWQPLSQQEIRSTYENAFGNATLDLTHVEFGNRPHRIVIKVRFGNVDVVVPRRVPVLVHGRTKLGHLEAFGREFSGGDVRSTLRSAGDPDLGQLTIISDVAFGNTAICREVPNAETGCQGSESRIDIGNGRVHIDLDGGDR
jgi:hypothetical protein